ncbi:MAG TPA: HD domain-containing phosphohydrolase [Bdellovibrionota bacterium]|nr:HD domain-containing phosphohydrolase [Bdellovibrionota bacterium]
MKEPKTFKRRFEGIKFLYVDDEPDNLESFELNFENQFEIVTSSSPVEALEIVRKESNLSVLVVDQVMPRMTGVQLAAESKKIRPTLTCIMITGNATKKLAIEAVRGRLFWEFLEKPVNFSAPDVRQIFVSAVQEHLLEKVKTEYHVGTIGVLAQLIDDKDGHTHAHSGRVTKWSLKIARKFDLSEKELVMIREGSLLHDIGKISIPDDILKKPGRLTELERKIIMTHPGRGGDLLEKVPQLKELAPIARYHHERPDGKGYPSGLKSEEIPLLASIVALADFFEALSSKRPYKEPWHIDDIVKEVASLRGTQFVEEVVDALFIVLEEEGLIKRERITEICSAIAA